VKFGFCRYHLKDEPLCKAHILPRAFYRRIIESDGEGFWLAERGNKFVKRMPGGLYDQNIICREADAEFGVYDNYASSPLSTWMPERLHITAGNREWYKIERFDYEKYCLFILSYIWRCHNFNMTPYKTFSIGAIFESRILNVLKQKKFSKEP
jgi:hypothetical protein